MVFNIQRKKLDVDRKSSKGAYELLSGIREVSRGHMVAGFFMNSTLPISCSIICSVKGEGRRRKRHRVLRIVSQHYG